MHKSFKVSVITCSLYFIFQVFAVGTPNPYRLRAFVSAKMPANGTFTQYINMYNPYSEPLQVRLEIIQTLGDFHFFNLLQIRLF